MICRFFNLSKMKNIYISIFISAFCLIFVTKKSRQKKGGIDLISNVYFDASKGLNKCRIFTFLGQLSE